MEKNLEIYPSQSITPLNLDKKSIIKICSYILDNIIKLTNTESKIINFLLSYLIDYIRSFFIFIRLINFQKFHNFKIY